ncbi:DGQHR domain-containing protein [Bacillus sp. CD3-1a]|uniref:DGQHR domain-containing protein n=1 Tax=Bacillus sp. CD3-1a TaxID=2587158 RepID=UPI001124A7BF|nr:DGQHR domain-containing protein [Bacillus sp. CD3-1a]TNO94764.1 DGQHR domain-containing protein [Bacillus sp. CD3-1a]
MKTIDINCIEVKQPIGTFYIGAINSNDLVFISYSDVRRIESESKDLEKYLGIQRPLSSKRIKELESYVNTIDATFPTSIILAISSSDVDFDKEKNVMTIKYRQETAKIIDGQHRIAGLAEYKGKHEEFQVNVTIFIDMDIEDQAMVFSTINLKQEKVSKSLGYDLFEFAQSRSPQKTCHNIAKLLNNIDGSPFKGRIKILGNATDKNIQTLTQATFVENLIKYVSKDPMKDRDILKRGKKIPHVKDKEAQDLFLRNMFIDGRDAEIAKLIFNYFKAVQITWPNAWNGNMPGNILNKTTGFTAFMRFLKDIYLSQDYGKDIISTDVFLSILETIDIQEQDFISTKYIPGSSGQTALYNDLMRKSKISRI